MLFQSNDIGLVSHGDKSTPTTIPMIWPNYHRGDKGAPMTTRELRVPNNLSNDSNNMVIGLKAPSGQNKWWTFPNVRVH